MLSIRFTGDWRANRMEVESGTGRQPNYFRKNGNKKRQISVMENWRTKGGYYYAELHETVMPISGRAYLWKKQDFFWQM